MGRTQALGLKLLGRPFRTKGFLTRRQMKDKG
jgi:hypothetical protein